VSDADERDDERYIKTKEAARLLGISERALLRQARAGNVPGAWHLGRDWLFLRSELLRPK
jgi:excisionase family DNA binding protein